MGNAVTRRFARAICRETEGEVGQYLGFDQSRDWRRSIANDDDELASNDDDELASGDEGESPVL